MKKVFRTLCLIAMIAFVATSCKKNEESADVNIEIGQAEGFQPGPSFDGSKAYIDANDNYMFKWNENDNVLVYNLASQGESYVAEYTADPGSEGLHKTGFTTSDQGMIGKLDLGFFVFYGPGMARGSVSPTDGNREVFTVSEEQTYNPTYKMDPNAFALACTYTGGLNHVYNFTLNHLFGYLNVAVANNTGAGAKKVRSIVVEDCVHNLSGKMTLKLPQVDMARFSQLIESCYTTGSYETAVDANGQSLYTYLNRELGYNSGDALQNPLHPKGKIITLNCNDYELPYGKWTYFFISLRPGALIDGYKLTVNYADGTSQTKIFANAEHGGSLTDANVKKNIVEPGYFNNIYWITSAGYYMSSLRHDNYTNTTY